MTAEETEILKVLEERIAGLEKDVARGEGPWLWNWVQRCNQVSKALELLGAGPLRSEIVLLGKRFDRVVKGDSDPSNEPIG